MPDDAGGSPLEPRFSVAPLTPWIPPREDSLCLRAATTPALARSGIGPPATSGRPHGPVGPARPGLSALPTPLQGRDWPSHLTPEAAGPVGRGHLSKAWTLILGSLHQSRLSLRSPAPAPTEHSAVPAQERVSKASWTQEPLPSFLSSSQVDAGSCPPSWPPLLPLRCLQDRCRVEGGCPPGHLLSLELRCGPLGIGERQWRVPSRALQSQDERRGGAEHLPPWDTSFHRLLLDSCKSWASGSLLRGSPGRSEMVQSVLGPPAPPALPACLLHQGLEPHAWAHWQPKLPPSPSCFQFHTHQRCSRHNYPEQRRCCCEETLRD
ncbi:uncharacterized protein LOC116470700 [Hylobates moloch]|uniref:uncharacterized protein LOC116470700 n=1 Tax=Hylobates moloch TaxID=81572 RepID=UPI0013627B67|nr:uncharacterized protein LOC116470700 [Hylobates moloch]